MTGKDLSEALLDFLEMLVVLVPIGVACIACLRIFIGKAYKHVMRYISQAWWKQAGIGASLAVGALTVTIVPAWLAGAYNPASVNWVGFANAKAPGIDLPRLWWFFTVQSLFEEMAYRATGLCLLGLLILWIVHFLFKPRLEGSQRQQTTAWAATGLLTTLVVSLSFANAHLHNPHVSTISYLNIALAGIVLGLLFWIQGNVLGAWVFHLVWNAGLATLGLPVSGMSISRPEGIACFSGAVPGLLTGGRFGPEGSALATLALALAAFAIIAASARANMAKLENSHASQGNAETNPSPPTDSN